MKKLVIPIISFLTVILSSVGAIIASFLIDSPFYINSIDDFMALKEHNYELVVLNTDLNFKEFDCDDLFLGNFYGRFEGNHHTISYPKFCQKSSNNLCLFENNYGTVIHLNVVSPIFLFDCEATSECSVSPICINNYGFITSVNITYYNDSFIECSESLEYGSLCVNNYGHLKNCCVKNTIKISCENLVFGSFCSASFEGKTEYCFRSGYNSLLSNNKIIAGCMIGIMDKSSISNCYLGNDGENNFNFFFNSKNYYDDNIIGIVAGDCRNNSLISNCFVNTNVTGNVENISKFGFVSSHLDNNSSASNLIFSGFYSGEKMTFKPLADFQSDDVQRLSKIYALSGLCNFDCADYINLDDLDISEMDFDTSCWKKQNNELFLELI